MGLLSPGRAIRNLSLVPGEGDEAAVRHPGARWGAIAATATLLSVLALFVYLVNPLGTYGTHLLPPIALHSRAEKVHLFQAYEPPAEIVILGSSMAFTMQPRDVTALTGRRAFNASVHGGSPRDYLALLRCMERLGRMPRTVVMLLSPDQMRPDLPRGFEPGDPLRDYLPDERAPRLWKVRQLLDRDSILAAVRSVRTPEDRRQPQYWFDPDGGGHLRPPANLEAVVDAYLASDWPPALFGFARFDPMEVARFQAALDLCHSHGTGVLVYLPPFHPRGEAVYARDDRLERHRGEIRDLLRSAQQEGRVQAAFDLTDLRSFGGDPSGFYDLAHPREENARRMLRVILADGNPAARFAP